MRTTIILTAALLAVAAFGQGQKGSIAGIVTDPGGKHPAGVAIQAKPSGSANAAKANSAAGGKYSLTDLAAGTYDISVNVPGLRGYEQKT